MDSSSRRRIGVLTIGQAPRDDTVPHLRPLLGDVEILERGALDGLSPGDIADLAPKPSPPDLHGGAPDMPLVTRLADGSEVTVGKRAILDRLQQAITDLEAERVDATLLICTGTFPKFDHTAPLMLADQLLVGAVRAIAGHGRVAVLCPLASQEQMTHEKWAPVVGPVEVASASPYGDRAAVVEAAVKFASGEAEFVVLDCIGFDEDHRRSVREACGRSVLLARSLVGRLAGEAVA
jgi:protein AroM